MQPFRRCGRGPASWRRLRLWKAVVTIAVLSLVSLTAGWIGSPVVTAQDAQTAGEPVRQWSVSRALPATQVRPDSYPSFYGVFLCGFAPLAAESADYCDLAAHRPGAASDSLCALARSFAQPEVATDYHLDVESPGPHQLYLNGVLVPTVGPEGGRDPVSGYDLTLPPGRNEILLKVYSAPAGWGFGVRSDGQLPPPRRHPSSAAPVWETDAVFLTSESVIHDPTRDVLYVSSFDNRYTQRAEPSGFLTRLSLEGAVLDERWIAGLEAPCGLALHDDRLYVVERHALAVVDVAAGAVVERYPLPETRFPNDVAVDAAGRVYVSDTRPNEGEAAVSVWRLEEGIMRPWLQDAAIGRANGLCILGDELLVGSSQDGCLKAVDLETRQVRTVASLGAGVVDGIRADGQGGVLVSLWQGQIFRVGPDGQPVELLDLLPRGRNTADFWYLPSRGLVLVPTFLANTVAAYEVSL